MKLLDSITNSMVMNLSKLQEIGRTEKAGVLQSMGSQRVRHNLVTKQQQNYTKYHSLIILDVPILAF